jgi:hypothetical protein
MLFVLAIFTALLVSVILELFESTEKAISRLGTRNYSLTHPFIYIHMHYYTVSFHTHYRPRRRRPPRSRRQWLEVRPASHSIPSRPSDYSSHVRLVSHGRCRQQWRSVYLGWWHVRQTRSWSRSRMLHSQTRRRPCGLARGANCLWESAYGRSDRHRGALHVGG